MNREQTRAVESFLEGSPEASLASILEAAYGRSEGTVGEVIAVCQHAGDYLRQRSSSAAWNCMELASVALYALRRFVGEDAMTNFDTIWGTIGSLLSDYRIYTHDQDLAVRSGLRMNPL